MSWSRDKLILWKLISWELILWHQVHWNNNFSMRVTRTNDLYHKHSTRAFHLRGSNIVKYRTLWAENKSVYLQQNDGNMGPGNILPHTTVSLIPSCCYDRFITCCAIPTTTPTTDLATHSSKWSQEVCNPRVSQPLLCGPKRHRSRVLRLHSRYGTPEKTSPSATYVSHYHIPLKLSFEWTYSRRVFVYLSPLQKRMNLFSFVCA